MTAQAKRRGHDLRYAPRGHCRRCRRPTKPFMHRCLFGLCGCCRRVELARTERARRNALEVIR